MLRGTKAAVMIIIQLSRTPLTDVQNLGSQKKAGLKIGIYITLTTLYCRQYLCTLLQYHLAYIYINNFIVWYSRHAYKYTM